jgi:hypothetical protein
MSEQKLDGLRNETHEMWHEIEILLESMKVDFLKAGSGNAAAATRARKGLKLLSDTSQDLRKKLLELRKLHDEVKSAKKQS